jgi:phosphoglycerol transferase MdoB-like AlkP superfamily enzyme
MTSIALIGTHPTSAHVLAGFEFSSSEVAGLLAFFAIAALLLVTYFAAFVAALVHSVQRLHRTGRLRHPGLVVAAPLLALVLAFQTRTTPVAPLFVAAAFAFGYAVMWRSGQGWFRWTALPVLPYLVAVVGTR